MPKVAGWAKRTKRMVKQHEEQQARKALKAIRKKARDARKKSKRSIRKVGISMPKYNFPMKLYFEERYRVKSRASVFHDFELVVDSKLSYSQIKNALMDKYSELDGTKFDLVIYEGGRNKKLNETEVLHKLFVGDIKHNDRNPIYLEKVEPSVRSVSKSVSSVRAYGKKSKKNKRK